MLEGTPGAVGRCGCLRQTSPKLTGRAPGLDVDGALLDARGAGPGLALGVGPVPVVTVHACSEESGGLTGVARFADQPRRRAFASPVEPSGSAHALHNKQASPACPSGARSPWPQCVPPLGAACERQGEREAPGRQQNCGTVISEVVDQRRGFNEGLLKAARLACNSAMRHRQVHSPSRRAAGRNGARLAAGRAAAARSYTNPPPHAACAPPHSPGCPWRCHTCKCKPRST